MTTTPQAPAERRPDDGTETPAATKAAPEDSPAPKRQIRQIRQRRRRKREMMPVETDERLDERDERLDEMLDEWSDERVDEATLNG